MYALAPERAVVQHARAAQLAANLGDLRPAGRNNNVKPPGHRLNRSLDQRFSANVGKHFVGSKTLALARSHNDATKIHGDTSPEAIVPITHAAGHQHRKRSSNAPAMQKGAPRRLAECPLNMVYLNPALGWNQRAVLRSSRALRVAAGSATFCRNIMAAMAYGL